MSDAQPVPPFDRRSTDANIAALSVRVRGLEGRVENLELDVKTANGKLTENTQMTSEVHDAVFGVEGEFEGIASMTRAVHTAVYGDGNGNAGLQQTLSDVHDIVTMGRGVFRGAQRVANGTARTADFLAGTLKRFWPLIAFGAAIATYLRTGKWEWPRWL